MHAACFKPSVGGNVIFQKLQVEKPRTKHNRMHVPTACKDEHSGIISWVVMLLLLLLTFPLFVHFIAIRDSQMAHLLITRIETIMCWDVSQQTEGQREAASKISVCCDMLQHASTVGAAGGGRRSLMCSKSRARAWAPNHPNPHPHPGTPTSVEGSVAGLQDKDGETQRKYPAMQMTHSKRLPSAGGEAQYVTCETCMQSNSASPASVALRHFPIFHNTIHHHTTPRNATTLYNTHHLDTWTHKFGPPCVTFRLVVAPLRGPGRSPVLPFACCVGSLLSVGRCGRCSCWCRFRVRGAQ